MVKMLQLIKKNRFDDCQYIISDEGNISCPEGPVWTIKYADKDLQDKYPGSIIRIYNDIPFLLSEKAISVIPVEADYTGTACIVRVEDTFLLVSDDKPYIQNCQGMRDNSDCSPIDTMLRELYEEMKLSPSRDRLKEIGYWSFDNNIDLVDATIECKTILFLLECSKEEVSHITTDLSSFNTIDFRSEEIEFIVTIPFNKLDDLPNNIRNKRINGHHIEVLRRYLNMVKKYDTNYLKSFMLY